MNKQTSFNRVYTPDTEWQKSITDMLKTIHHENTTRHIGYELYIKNLLFEIWRICGIHSSQSTAPASDKTIENIKNGIVIIQSNYSSPLTLDDIANHINMSKGHFCRRFSDIIHITPFEYLIRIRIENSCRMLTDTSLSIGEIAQECGFNSFSYFSKTFRQSVGYTPREYSRLQNNRN